MKKSTGWGIKEVFPFIMMASLFIVVDGLALLIINPLESVGANAFENQNDPMNLVILFLTMLLFTAAILFISKHRKRATHGIFLGAIGLFFFYFFYFLLITTIPDPWSLSISTAATIILVTILIKYPEWYVIDTAGIIMAAGSVAMFGISLNIPLVIILLIVMAVYDAISVYKTKHMIELADSVMASKVPVMLIIPKIRGYSLIKDKKSLKEKLKDEEREAFFIGLGDIVFPGILFASTFYNMPNNGLLLASSVIIGTLLGLVVLMRTVAKGKPQAGLPFLSTGAILGYIISSYLIFGKIVGLALF